MMRTSVAVLSLWAATTTSLSLVQAWPTVELNSREYKAMLNPALFVAEDDTTREATVMKVLQDLQTDLALAAVTAKAVDTSGEFELKDDTPRLVRYYDTPGDCQLRRHGLTLRMRRSLDEWSDDPWEAMFKTRSGDRYHTAIRSPAVQGCNTQVSTEAKHKFEEDVGHFDWTGSIFSFSQKCYFAIRALPAKIQNTLGMVPAVWENAELLLQAELELDMTEPLALVGNQTITEIAYEDFWIYLDADDYGDDDAMAQAKVTLWYKTMEGLQTDQQSTSSDSEEEEFAMPSWTGVGDPIVAELSFRIKSKHEAWTDDTIMNMHNLWDQLGKSLSKKWLDPLSMSKTNKTTKTAWIYRFESNFCQAGDEDEDSS